MDGAFSRRGQSALEDLDLLWRWQGQLYRDAFQRRDRNPRSQDWRPGRRRPARYHRKTLQLGYAAPGHLVKSRQSLRQACPPSERRTREGEGAATITDSQGQEMTRA